MTWEIFVGIATLVSFVAIFVKLTRDLTVAVTGLKCAVDALGKRFDESQTVTVKRLDAHGKKIDEHDVRITKNEQDLANIKEKVDYFHHN